MLTLVLDKVNLVLPLLLRQRAALAADRQARFLILRAAVGPSTLGAHASLGVSSFYRGMCSSLLPTARGRLSPRECVRVTRNESAAEPITLMS